MVDSTPGSGSGVRSSFSANVEVQEDSVCSVKSWKHSLSPVLSVMSIFVLPLFGAISRNVYSDVSFLEQHHRLVCTSCKYCYNERWIRSGCRRAVGSGKRCGGKLCYRGLEAAIHSVNKFVKLHGDKEDLCCFKIDMKNGL